MFGGVTKVLADTAGLANNCSVFIGPAAVVSHSQYLSFLLPDEEPQILLQCSKGEYIFTDCAVVWVYGDAAAGRKRDVNRLDYREHKIASVSFETAGINDWDCQIKIRMGANSFAIDIKKDEQDAGIKVYRILTAVSAVQESEGRYYALAASTFQSALGSSLTADRSVLDAMTGVVMQGAEAIADKYMRRSYKDVFARYGAL